MGLWYLWFYVQELPKAQPAVVLVLKRLRRRVNGLKSHPTDWEKPGIEPATPGLQDIGLSPTPRRLHNVDIFGSFSSALALIFIYLTGPFIKYECQNKIRYSKTCVKWPL